MVAVIKIIIFRSTAVQLCSGAKTQVAYCPPTHDQPQPWKRQRDTATNKGAVPVRSRGGRVEPKAPLAVASKRHKFAHAQTGRAIYTAEWIARR